MDFGNADDVPLPSTGRVQSWGHRAHSRHATLGARSGDQGSGWPHCRTLATLPYGSGVVSLAHLGPGSS